MGVRRRAAVAALGTGGLTAVAPDVPAPDRSDDARTRAAHWVAHLAVALSTAAVRGPVLLVLVGATGALAPALGLSQRAARRTVAGYALLDADCPDAGALPVDWPDAPVHYLASPAAPGPALDHARLRAWRVHEVADLDAATVAAALAAVAAA